MTLAEMKEANRLIAERALSTIVSCAEYDRTLKGLTDAQRRDGLERTAKEALKQIEKNCREYERTNPD